MVTFTILVLFWILVYTVIVLYCVLNQRILDINKLIGTMKENELKAWKHQHVLVVHFEHLINRCFGSVFLVFICDEFIIIIRASYRLILAVEARKQLITTIFSLIIIREFFFLSVFVFLSSLPNPKKGTPRDGSPWMNPPVPDFYNKVWKAERLWRNGEFLEEHQSNYHALSLSKHWSFRVLRSTSYALLMLTAAVIQYACKVFTRSHVTSH